jgi:hypothetical protein
MAGRVSFAALVGQAVQERVDGGVVLGHPQTSVVLPSRMWKTWVWPSDPAQHSQHRHRAVADPDRHGRGTLGDEHRRALGKQIGFDDWALAQQYGTATP